MTMPSVELRCDTCAEAAFLYRLHGTQDALCQTCFVVAHPPETQAQRRQRRARHQGAEVYGCLRGLRTAPGAWGVHRLLGTPRS